MRSPILGGGTELSVVLAESAGNGALLFRAQPAAFTMSLERGTPL
jgi:hypothetical protein